MRFNVVETDQPGVYKVWDGNLNQHVPNQAGFAKDMYTVSEVLNQRVIFPELTRADGKLVSA